MDAEMVKGKPLTREESKFLLDLVEDSKILLNKKTNATNNKLKTKEWIRLTERFNAKVKYCPRTPQQLRLKWENMKKNARKRSTKIKMNKIESGGGPTEFIPPDEILDRITELLDSPVSGLTETYGGDSETVWFVVGDGKGRSGGEDTTRPESLLSMDMESDSDNQLLDVVEQNNTAIKNKRLAFSTPRTVKRQVKADENRTARNSAIAEYYAAKKKCLEDKLINIKLENDNFKLKNIELKLTNEKLVLETKMLRLELDKLQQLG